MAITFVAAASAVRTSSGSSISVNKPTGTQQGDVLVAVVGVVQETVTNPAGWTTLDTVNQGSAARIHTAYKVAGASEGGTYEFSLSASQDDVAVSVAAFRGCANPGPVRDNAGTSGGSVTSLASPSLTGTQSTDMVVIFGGGRPSGSGPDNECTAPSTGGWTAASGAHSGDSDPGSFPQSTDIAYQINGTTGTFTYTASTNACTAAVSLVQGSSTVSGSLGAVSPLSLVGLASAAEVAGVWGATAPVALVGLASAAEVAGTLGVEAPGPESAWTGSVGGIATGTLGVSAPAPSVVFNAEASTSGSLAIASPRPAVAFASSSGSTGAIAAVSPPPSVAFNVEASASGPLALSSPRPVATLDGFASEATNGPLGITAPLPVLGFQALFKKHKRNVLIDPEERVLKIQEDRPVGLFEV